MAEEYITIGAKEKCQPYVGDLSIITWIRQHTHTQTQNTRARMRTQHQNKQNKEGQECQSRKTTESRRIMVLKYFTIFSSFQEELA